MDLNSPKQLDPKLQEAYERVMGTGVSQNSKQTQPAPYIQAAEQVQKQNSSAPQSLSQMEQEITSSPILQSNSYINPALTNEKVTDDDSPVKSSEKHHKSLAYVLGGGLIIFLVIYAVVWAKIFGLF